MKQCLRLTISGKVQRVGFREFVKKHAEKLEVEGTVQNSNDGTILIEACAPAENLDQLMEFLYKGPSTAKVEDVAAQPLGTDKDFRGVFRIIGFEL